MPGSRTLDDVRPHALEAFEPRVLLSTYYVSPAGSDGAAGTSTAAAWQSLQKAADTAVAGDTVHVLAGTYPVGMNFYGKTGGTAAAPVQFLADPGAVITHAADSGHPNDDLAGINVENTAGYFVFKGFTVNSDGSMQRAGIRVAFSPNVQILDNTVDHAFIGIFVSNADNVLIQGNTCRNATDQHGIYVSANTHNTVVRNNTLYGNAWDGLHMNCVNGASNDGALVEGNVIYGNTLSGMDIEGVTNATFRNNVIYGNGKHGITVHSQDQDNTPAASKDTFVNNTIANNGMFAIQIKSEDTQGQVLFNNVLLSSNGVYGSIGTSGTPAGLTSDYNTVVDNFSTTLGLDQVSLTGWRTSTGQDQHSVIATPDQLFVNSDGGNYRLRTGAPAVDAGTNTLAGRQAPPADVDGSTRPQGATWDAGAYESSAIPDTTPPVISGVTTPDVRPTRATLSWATNEIADAQVEFGPTDAYGQLSALDPALRLSHAVTLTSLQGNTTYRFRIRARDAYGNLALSDDYTFTTPPIPTALPVISAIATDPWVTGATLSWKTDLDTDAAFDYGLTTDYGSAAPPDAVLRTSHTVTLDGLLPATTYHFRIRARDEYGNTAYSPDQTFTTATPGQLPAGPVAYWNFDQPGGTTVDDLSGNGNTGTLLGAPDFVPGRDPAHGDALSFDGVADRVHVPRSPSLEPATVTLSAWVRLALGADQQQWVTVVKKTYANDTPPIFGSYSLSIAPPGKPNTLSFYTGHPGGLDDQLDAPAPLTTGQWVHVAGTYDPATGVKRLYINGELVATRQLSRPIAYDPTSSGDLYIGEDPGPAEAFRGQIDDVGVWGRALSPGEIRTLAYGQPAALPPAASPTDLTATVVTYTDVRLAWTDHTGGTARFLLQRRNVTGGRIGAWRDVASLDPGVTSFEDLTAAGSQYYEYRVFAYNDAASSAPSASAFATTFAGGPGLLAEYFDTPDLTGNPLTRIDTAVNFDWGQGSPLPGIAPGTYSVRWSGQVLAFVSGTYTFYTTADDGVRLWVNGQLLINNWIDRAKLLGDVNNDGVVNFVDYQILERQFGTTNAQCDLNGDGVVNSADFTLLYNNLGKTLANTTPSNSASITLQANTKYDIRLEYYQSDGVASAKLEWATPVLSQRVIPTDQLFPPPPPPPPPLVAVEPVTTAITTTTTKATTIKATTTKTITTTVQKQVPRPLPPPKPVFSTKRVDKPTIVPRVTTFLPPKKPPIPKPPPPAKARH
jgi:parallel beta-helix repeat protein